MKNSKDSQVKTPRPYLSWSSFNLFQRSQEEWRRVYLMGNKRDYRGAEFGSKFAKARELDEDSGDNDIEFARMFMPVYPKREYTMKIHNGICVVLGKFDGYDPKKRLIADDKTTKKLIQNGKPGFKWTQQKVDDFKQLTFYGYIYWKKFGVIPNFELNWYDFDSKQLKTFKTERKVVDFLRLHNEINEVWAGIISLCRETYEIV